MDSCLYVVVEGWNELELTDPAIDAHLNNDDGSELVGAIRRHRNGVFHYQQTYWDERRTGFSGRGAESAVWVHELHDRLGALFLRQYDEHRGATTTTTTGIDISTTNG